jgi:hypothetical protein
MGCHKRIGWLGFIFLVLFLLVSLPKAVSAGSLASDSGSPPVPVGTIPLATNAVTGATETERPYKLTFKLGALFLRRGDNHDNRLVNWADSGPLPPAGVHARVYSDDLDLGWAPGMDASIMLQNKEFGVEVRYMGLTQWNESKNDSDYDMYWGDEAHARAKLKSALNSVELNVHWWPCANDRYSLLAGFRWLRLTDRLMWGYDTAIYGYDQSYGEGNNSSRNSLYGAQIGIEGLLFGKRDQGFSLDGSVKTGMYTNKITNQDSGYEWYYGSWSDRQKSNRGVNLSELGINLNYAFTKNIAMTVGYELLYISRIATPVNDWGGTQSVLYQGTRAGLNISF